MSCLSKLKHVFLLQFVLLSPLFINKIVGQIGGTSVYGFLKLDPSAHTAALGGSLISIPDTDLGSSLQNPALLQNRHHNHIALNYNNYLGDLNYGYVAYARDINEGKNKKPFMLATHLLYFDYGSFDGYDEFGSATGTFTANEFMMGFTASMELDKQWSVGSSMKWIYSTLESYISNGVAFDAGAFYNNEKNNLSVGMIIKNAGWQNIAYRGTSRANLPFEAQIAITKKPEHAPFRVTLLLHNLQKWDLTHAYQDPIKRRFDEFNNPIPYTANFFEKAFRHVNIGSEIILSPNFMVRGSYNHLRRVELGPDIRKGVAGFAWGLAFKIKKIRFEYGSAGFFPGYNSNLFSVILNLNEFYN